MAMKKCPVCGVSVKVENLERHVHDQHPRTHVEPEQILTNEERLKVRRTGPASRPVMTRRGKMIAVAVAVILVLVIFAVVLRPNVGLGVGQVAPDFTATTSDGGTVRLSSMRGLPVFLEFMDIDCPHCINEAGVLAGLHATYSGRVTFLSVDVDFSSLPPPDDASRINAFRIQHNNTWTFALPNTLTTETYGVTGTPTMYVLDRNSVVSAAFFGETSASVLAGAFDRVLQA